MVSTMQMCKKVFVMRSNLAWKYFLATISTGGVYGLICAATSEIGQLGKLPN